MTLHPAEPDSEAAALAMVENALVARWPENRIAADLTRERALMELLGSPEFSAPVVHVAGTNGKTSTTRMVESLLRAAGLHTGMFTSPHLESVRERICLDGEPIGVAEFVRLYDEMAGFLALVDDRVGRLTYFEAITGMAFAAFADAPSDAMAIECGMGGTWDATNVVQPSVCVITPIGMDHQEYLGDTLAAVAGEKAGIITAPVPVISATQDPQAEEVLRARATEAGAELLVAGEDFRIIGRAPTPEGQVLDFAGLAGDYDEVMLPLRGRHMAENAALALAAVEAFLGSRPLDPALVREGFAAASSPGRLEVLRESPPVVADAAHNPQGAASLAAALVEGIGFTRVVAVLAVLADKDVDGLLSALAGEVDRVVVTGNSSPRCLPAAELGARAAEVWGEDLVTVIPELPGALELALQLADEDPTGATGVLVTGSVVTVADARRVLGRV